MKKILLQVSLMHVKKSKRPKRLTFLESTASAMIFIQPLKVATWKRER